MTGETYTPDYARCSLYELVQVLNTIVPDRAPNAHTALLAEIEGRAPVNAQEAQSCWNRLDRERFPALADRLAQQFAALEKAQLDELARTHGKDNTGKPLPPPHRTFWRRVVAWVLDMVILTVLEAPLAYLVARVGSDQGGATPSLVDTWSLGSMTMLYFIGMHARFGWTLGKRIMSLQVVDAETGNRIGFVQALARYLDRLVLSALYLPLLIQLEADLTAVTEAGTLTIVGGVLLLLTFVWLVADTIVAFADERHRALHDRIGATVVRRLPRTR